MAQDKASQIFPRADKLMQGDVEGRDFFPRMRVTDTKDIMDLFPRAKNFKG